MGLERNFTFSTFYVESQNVKANYFLQIKGVISTKHQYNNKNDENDFYWKRYLV